MTSKTSGVSIVIGYIQHLIQSSLIVTGIYFVLYPYYNVIYDKLSSYSFMEDAYIYALLISAVHITFYWSINSFFLYCDTYKVLQQFKIPRLKSQQVSQELLYKTLGEALFAQLIIEPLANIFILWPLFKYHGSKIRLPETPTFVYVFSEFLLAHLLFEWLFYFFHRLLHHPKLYGWIHKQHHEYKGSIGFAAEYAHPIEGLLANYYPTLAGCLHTGAHPLIFIVYLFSRLEHTYEHHSGYSFEGSFLYKIGLTHSYDTLCHDFHHSRNIGNYGCRIHDWLFGTDDGYDKWLNDWYKQKE